MQVNTCMSSNDNQVRNQAIRQLADQDGGSGLTTGRVGRPDRMPDAGRRCGHVEMPHAERRQRVHHRIHNGGGGGDGAGLTASLHAQPVGAAWKVARQIALERGKIIRARQRIVHQRARQDLPGLGIEQRVLEQRLPDPLRHTAMDLPQRQPGIEQPAVVVKDHVAVEPDLAGLGVDALRGTRTDATFLLDRVATMPGDSFTREAFYDLINPSCELLPGDGTPTRTTAAYGGARRAWQTGPLRHQRPDLRREIVRAPRTIRRVSPGDAQTLITLAREAMITRNRDLDAFAYGNEADVWLCDDGNGVAFVLVGMQPERRTVLPAIYGGLTLRNGVPVGYLQADFLGRTVAAAFNTFETFRGGESATIFGWLLATLHAFSGATSFSVEPYQLGQGNDEGIESGAWWFYFKLGFRPRARAAARLATAEAQRQKAKPGYRSSPDTLRRLAEHHLFLDLDANQPAPLLLPASIGLRVGAFLSSLAPDNRAAALERALELAGARVGLASQRGFTRNERAAWSSLAPLLAAMPMQGWTAEDRGALIPLVRAKGARSERAYAHLSSAHRKLEAALTELSSPARA